MTHYWSQVATDGKCYITVFHESKDGKTHTQILPEAHDSHEAAHEWAKAHGLPILEAQAVYFDKTLLEFCQDVPQDSLETRVARLERRADFIYRQLGYKVSGE